MTDKLTVIANAANCYDLTELLDIICNYYSSPDTVRKHLMQCYMYIAHDAITHGTDYITTALTTLSLIIEALDNTEAVTTPQLVVTAKI